jgi:hypothetical protein
MVLGGPFFSVEHRGETTIVARLAQEWEHVDDGFAEHLITLSTRDALHRAVPHDELAVAIKREDAIDARVDKSG